MDDWLKSPEELAEGVQQAAREPTSVGNECLAAGSDLICFSHLRWDFVHQRPQHLMERFSRTKRVIFFEEMIPTSHHLPYLETHVFQGTAVVSIRPRLPDRFGFNEQARALSGLLDHAIQLLDVVDPILWFYTPAMWPIAAHVRASAIVYDCMDELSAFRFAAPDLKVDEAKLLNAADVVFTGGYSLYEAKRAQHANIHPFPSSVDQTHFNRARLVSSGPEEQGRIPPPRLGYCGVIDERIDLNLLAHSAALRPDWSFVMIGPVAKIADHELPRAPNIHYLGPRSYADLPEYMAGWDVALMPFATNEATRFISPTKTPEYLAAGCPVVSTPVPDVVRAYGDMPGVWITPDAASFIDACAEAISAGKPVSWRAEVDRRLSGLSWDATHAQMSALVESALMENVR